MIQIFIIWILNAMSYFLYSVYTKSMNTFIENNLINPLFCPLDSLPCSTIIRSSKATSVWFRKYYFTSIQDCTECISGYYCDVEGLAVPIDCPPGYFCVSGSITPQPCPLGTYSNSTGLRRSTDCTPCPGGQYCDGIGRTEPAGLCDPGFYCREKAYTSAPPDGPTGGLCPAGG